LLTKDRKFTIIGSLIVGGAIVVYIFLSFAISKVQLKFKDRAAAATILASVLKDTLRNAAVLQTPAYNKEQKKEEDIIVLGIPRGGVIIADIVARELSADFDIVIGRKLCSPDSKENAIGAIVEDGTIAYLNQSLINSLQISSAYIKKEKSDQLKEIKRKAAMYRDRAMSRRRLKLKGRTVILVDDGIATGATIIAAIRWIKRQEPKHFIVAVPVIPKQIVNLLKKETIDAIQFITTPSSSNFISVGQFYQNFNPISDEQVIGIMRKNIQCNYIL
jgi:putative phosphoribosyl transferase